MVPTSRLAAARSAAPMPVVVSAAYSIQNKTELGDTQINHNTDTPVGRQSTTIMLTEHREGANMLASALCHHLHTERDIAINSILLDGRFAFIGGK